MQVERPGRVRDSGAMKFRPGCALVVSGWFFFSFLSVPFCTKASVNVTQHHNHETRDGLYFDPAFTKAAAQALKRDLTFNGTISGNVYAQPLYIEGGPGGKSVVITVTESNNVYALDAADGTIIWQRHVGQPVARASLPRGN